MKNLTLHHGQHIDDNEKLTYQVSGVTYTVRKT